MASWPPHTDKLGVLSGGITWEMQQWLRDLGMAGNGERIQSLRFEM